MHRPTSRPSVGVRRGQVDGCGGPVIPSGGEIVLNERPPDPRGKRAMRHVRSLDGLRFCSHDRAQRRKRSGRIMPTTNLVCDKTFDTHLRRNKAAEISLRGVFAVQTTMWRADGMVKRSSCFRFWLLIYAGIRVDFDGQEVLVQRLAWRSDGCIAYGPRILRSSRASSREQFCCVGSIVQNALTARKCPESLTRAPGVCCSAGAGGALDFRFTVLPG